MTPDVGGALGEDPVVAQQIVELVDDGLELVEKDLGAIGPALGEVVRDAPDPVVVVEQPRAAEPLEEIQNLLALAKAVEKRRERAEVHPVGAEGQQVRGDALELGRDDPDRLRRARSTSIPMSFSTAIA